jgi:hypothetical protein
MTDGDLDRIEAAIGIVLPTAYRKLVVPFPVPAYVGNSDSELWDDADRLVELNRELRAGMTFLHPWPAHMFCMGRDQSGSCSAIDLQDPACPVWWADRGHLDAVGSGQTSPSLPEWAGPYVADLRSDLEGNGIDPDGPPAAREQAAQASARAGCQFILALIGVSVVLVFVVWVLLKWLL